MNSFRGVARRTFDRTLDELQTNADAWIREYNVERAHSGRYCYRETAMQTFLDAKHLAHEKMLDRTDSYECTGQRPRHRCLTLDTVRSSST